ncbi:tetratricopeptide repeat protein [Desulfobacter sp.]|uniref:tetratricopeptide repeat protein n=1 Tax=Desulfobacter sp. TaxID=2294 RepID=UPI003D0DEDAF
MAKKRNTIDVILKRAEKLFETGNYLLAEKEFKKARQKQNSPEIEEKLAICLKNTQGLKGREWVKKGQKAESRNDLSGAVSCFREADGLLHETWLGDKIREIEQRLLGCDMVAKAETAVRNKDYQAAYGFYTELAQIHENENYLSDSAVCLVKTNMFDQAVELFRSLNRLSEAARYHFGYALAKQGRYIDALGQWEMIDSNAAAFVSQQHQVLELAVEQLNASMKAGADLNGILADAGRLLGGKAVHGNDRLVKELGAISDYCRLALAAPLWETGDYGAVATLLDTMIFKKDPAITVLCAVTYYHLAEIQADYTGLMADHWLTAVYATDLARTVGDDPEKQDRVRQRLVRMAEDRINTMAGSKELNGAVARLFEIDKSLMADFLAISGSRHGSPSVPWICTPCFAKHYGLSDTVLALIRENRDYFRDEAHYLSTGACYSRVGESFYALKTRSAKDAFNLIGTMDAPDSADEFINYALGLIRFEYGKFVLENGEKNFLDYFDSTVRLFETVPGMEKQFSQEMLQYEGQYLFEHEALLGFLYQLRPSGPISEAYSFVMGQTAVNRFNRGRINNKQCHVALEKALAVDPGNEYVIHLQAQIAIDLEMEALYNAMNKRKMGKAATLATKSSFPEIRDKFFDFIEQMMEHIEDSELEKPYRIVELNELLNSCMAVDPVHPIIDTLEMKIQLLGD